MPGDICQRRNFPQVTIGKLSFESASAVSLLRGLNSRMFTLPVSRLPALFGLCLGLHLEIATAQEGPSLSDPKDVLSVLPTQSAAGFNFKIPPKPSGRVLDTAHFLGSEMLQRIEEILSKEVSANGVEVFLLTIPSVQKGALNAFTQKVAEAWTKDVFGAVIVFDDGTGNVAVQASEKVTNRFYEFELWYSLLQIEISHLHPIDLYFQLNARIDYIALKCYQHPIFYCLN